MPTWSDILVSDILLAIREVFHSLLVFWLIVADPFLVTQIGASLWELFAETVNLTEVCVLQHIPSECEGRTNCCSLQTQLDDLNQCNNRNILGQKDSKHSTIKQSLTE